LIEQGLTSSPTKYRLYGRRVSLYDARKSVHCFKAVYRRQRNAQTLQTKSDSFWNYKVSTSA